MGNCGGCRGGGKLVLKWMRNYIEKNKSHVARGKGSQKLGGGIVLKIVTGQTTDARKTNGFRARMNKCQTGGGGKAEGGNATAYPRGKIRQAKNCGWGGGS